MQQMSHCNADLFSQALKRLIAAELSKFEIEGELISSFSSANTDILL